jgi:glutamate carboxypeptidase
MLAIANSLDSKAILDGIRRRVDIETPTETPDWGDRLATLVADGCRDTLR